MYGDRMGTPPTQTQAVAAIVTQAMEVRGISVKALAETTLIPRTTLMRRLAGVAPFTLDELEAIAGRLDRTASDLMAAADEVRA